MSKYGQVEFEKQVVKAYDIIWKMYQPQGEGSCPWDSMQESMLKEILNAIDDVLGRC